MVPSPAEVCRMLVRALRAPAHNCGRDNSVGNQLHGSPPPTLHKTCYRVRRIGLF